MGNVLEYRIARNYEEYLEICKETFLKDTQSNPYSSKKQTPFDTVDDWAEFFDYYEFRDEKYDDVENWEEVIKNFQGELNYKPEQEEYPVLVAYNFTTTDDRFGDVTNQLWDWVSLSKLDAKDLIKI